MKLDVYSLSNEKVGEVEVSDGIFGADVKPHLFHEVVRMQRANRRAGTHKTKTRTEVSGGGAKPFRQKGTGRARQGSTRSPHWVGGGHTFAKRPRDYSFSLNKKKRRAALRSALSQLVAEGRLKVVDAFELEAIGTQDAAKTLLTLSMEKAVVVDGRRRTGEPGDDASRQLLAKIREIFEGDAAIKAVSEADLAEQLGLTKKALRGQLAAFDVRPRATTHRRKKGQAVEKGYHRRELERAFRRTLPRTGFENNENLRLSVRNLSSFKYLRPDGVNVYDVLHYGSMVVTQEGLKGLEERLG